MSPGSISETGTSTKWAGSGVLLKIRKDIERRSMMRYGYNYYSNTSHTQVWCSSPTAGENTL